MHKKLNILIFLVDQMRGDMVLPDSPCIMSRVKKFAEEGVTFSHCYTPSPHCCPSRTSLMTGVYPTKHGVWNNINTATVHQYGHYPEIKTYAHMLRNAGYITEYAGKVHVTNTSPDAKLGWDKYTGVQNGKAIKCDNQSFYKFSEGKPDQLVKENSTREFSEVWRPGWDKVKLCGNILKGDKQIERALWYENGVAPGIARLKELANQDTPWCLCVSTDMDWNNSVPDDILSMYDPDKILLPSTFYDSMEDKPRAYRRYREMYAGQLTEKELKAALARYYALCTLQDRFFGMLLDVLDASSQKDNTLVLFVGDHGDYVFEHGLFNMGFIGFREAYHVPAIIRWPVGVKNPGRIEDNFISLVDFAPTFCEIAGTEMPENQQTGISFTPYLYGSVPHNPRDTVFHMTNGNETYFIQRIVMTKQWRYVINWFDYDELYDLQNDPEQTKNLLYEFYLKPAKICEPDTVPDGPWPYLPDTLERIRKEAFRRYWEFAISEEDMTFSQYYTAALTPYGPGISGRDFCRIRNRERELYEEQKPGILR